MPKKSKAVFLDRDGVINEERGYVHTPDQFVLIPGIVDAIRRLSSSGFKVVVVTNQSGIARGLFDIFAVDRLHQHFKELLGAEGVRVDGIYSCPHHPEGKVAEYAIVCDCRKPMPGLLLRAADELCLDLSASYLVGDKLSDIQAGQRAAVKATFLVRTGYRPSAEAIACADYVAQDAYEAITMIGLHSSKRPESRNRVTRHGLINEKKFYFLAYGDKKEK